MKNNNKKKYQKPQIIKKKLKIKTFLGGSY